MELFLPVVKLGMCIGVGVVWFPVHRVVFVVVVVFNVVVNVFVVVDITCGAFSVNIKGQFSKRS